MKYAVTEESLANLSSYWNDFNQHLNQASLFVSPDWLETWWQVFGSGSELFLRVVRRGDSLIGMAPLMSRGETVSFIGSENVCDYLDFVVEPGNEDDFFFILLDYLKERGINQLDLKHVRSDSTVSTHLLNIAKSRDYQVIYDQEEISVEMDLPDNWDDYMAALTAKQRHEVRRKLRRLSEVGRVEYRFIEDSAAVPGAMDTFFKMFTESREDKALFMTEQIESFFRLLAANMAKAGLLKIGVLELDTQLVAIIMCFDYNDSVYLYNSGYDTEYTFLSVGLLSKVFCIKDSIERGRKRFDFLKGDESYKYHLGGKEVPLYRCRITIN